MKKQYIFTEDSSFTHLKDKMQHSVTEHIIENVKTKMLYHHVVSYGSWFSITYESIFMSHLLKKIGVTGFGVSYSVDNCKIDLPWYPACERKAKTIVELPKEVKLEDIGFGHSKKEFAAKWKQTFLSKTFIKRYKDGKQIKILATDLLKEIFGCDSFRLCEFVKGEESYPFYCLLSNVEYYDKEYLKRLLLETDISYYDEIKEIFERFLEVDISKDIMLFEQETGVRITELSKDLLARQKIIKEYLDIKIQIK